LYELEHEDAPVCPHFEPGDIEDWKTEFNFEPKEWHDKPIRLRNKKALGHSGLGHFNRTSCKNCRHFQDMRWCADAFGGRLATGSTCDSALGDFKICIKELYHCLETLGYLASNQHVFVWLKWKNHSR